jgi:hypothetical protein
MESSRLCNEPWLITLLTLLKVAGCIFLISQLVERAALSNEKSFSCLLYWAAGLTSSSLTGLRVFGSIQIKGSFHRSVSSILTKWLHRGHLGPRASKMVSGHLQWQSTASNKSLRPSYLGIRGGLHASQKVLTSLTPLRECPGLIRKRGG